ncbi:MAG: xanthine dehydrogenase family protein subunit M [Lautropia sp.]
MYAFAYARAADAADAARRLAADADAKLLAGGMTLIPSMKHRLAAPGTLVDIGGLAELRGISLEKGRLVVGAGTRHAMVATDTDVARTLPALATLAGLIGDAQVRNRGTLGGSIANNDPAADYPAAVLALDATIHTDRRTIAADDFFVDMFTTALEPDEIVLRVGFRVPARAAYAKFHHPASGYAMAGVFVADFGDAVRVAVTGAGPSVFRWAEAEAALGHAFSVASVVGLQHPEDGLNTDLHAPARYRAHLVGVMTRRAVAQAIDAGASTDAGQTRTSTR